MYIAKRELKGADRTYKPGDEIPGFETWPLVTQRAHLNLEWVEKVDTLPEGKQDASTSQEKTPKKGKKR